MRQFDGSTRSDIIRFHHGSNLGDYCNYQDAEDIVPLEQLLPLEIELPGNTEATCKVEFTISEDFKGGFVNFGYELSGAVTKSVVVKIMTKPQRVKTVPVLGLFELLLTFVMLGICGSRFQRDKKSLMVENIKEIMARKFLKIIMNKVIFILLFSGGTSHVIAQPVVDVSLKLSTQEFLFLGEANTLFLEVENTGSESVDFSGNNISLTQEDGLSSSRTIEFNYDTLISNSLLKSRSFCHFPYDIGVISYKNLFLDFELEAQSKIVCQIDFTIPRDFKGNFINYGYEIKAFKFHDPNLSNNVAQVRLNIKKRQPINVPSLNWLGLSLITVMLGIIGLLSEKRKSIS